MTTIATPGDLVGPSRIIPQEREAANRLVAEEHGLDARAVEQAMMTAREHLPRALAGETFSVGLRLEGRPFELRLKPLLEANGQPAGAVSVLPISVFPWWSEHLRQNEIISAVRCGRARSRSPCASVPTWAG